jgi:hypothetical protein
MMMTAVKRKPTIMTMMMVMMMKTMMTPMQQPNLQQPKNIDGP